MSYSLRNAYYTVHIIQYICTEYADVVVVLIVWRYMCIMLCIFDKYTDS